MARKADIGAWELAEARRGFLHLLRRKRMSPRFIENYAQDLLGEAHLELSLALSRDANVTNAVGWIINCAWWRTANLIDKLNRRPAESPIHEMTLKDDSIQTPEEAVLTMERQRELQQLVAFLPPGDRRLIELAYFGGMSIREAGRNLSWGKSAANHHHRAAMERLRCLLSV